MSEESWTEKYRPTVWSDLQGNNSHLDDLKRWCREWSEGDEAQLLVGTQGTGKTSTAYVISNKRDWPLNQINASDKRSSEDLEHMAASIQTTPPDAEHQLVLIDEVDSQSARTNKTPLYDALDNPKNPVIITANDEYDVPGGIKSRAEVREFKLQKRSRKAKLRDIAKEEGLWEDMSDADLDDLADRPDLRSAIHDLQVWAEQDIPPGQDEREIDIGEFEVVDNILRGVKESGDMSPPDLVLWLDENIRKEFRGVEAMTAYDTLANADKWLHRAQKEDYRFWKYAGELAEQTANQRLTEPYDGWLDKDFPEWFRHKKPNPTGEKAKARLFRKLKDWDGGSYRFAGGFPYFIHVLLPVLNELPVEDRMEMALHYNLEDDEVEALGISSERFSKWQQSDVPEERQESEQEIRQQDILEW
jgi:replication factor C large subunit